MLTFILGFSIVFLTLIWISQHDERVAMKAYNLARKKLGKVMVHNADGTKDVRHYYGDGSYCDVIIDVDGVQYDDRTEMNYARRWK